VTRRPPPPPPGSNPAFLVQQNSLRDAILAALNLNIVARHAMTAGERRDDRCEPLPGSVRLLVRMWNRRGVASTSTLAGLRWPAASG
jgi:hypothetical protein